MTSNLAPAADLAAKRKPRFANESAEYAAGREALLAEEIEVRRHLGRLAAQLRALPEGPEIAEDFRFVDPNGDDVGLAEMFGDHDTLVIYHWMYGPDRERPCPMCTATLGSLNGNGRDIEQRVALAVTGRSSVERQIAFAQERGWHGLRFFQSKGDDWALRIGGLDPDEGWEYPALLVLRKDGDKVRLHWMGETNGEMADPGEDPRGAVELQALWNVLDLTPGGRGADWYPKLSYAGADDAGGARRQGAGMSLPGPTSNSFISQRLRLHYVDWGNPEAPPLILQHGGRDHCRSWDWVADELRHDWHVIAPDLRGHGDSAWSPEGHYGMDAFVYDFAQLVHTLGYDQVTIAAHSLGGNIATRFTGLYPEKVRKLVNIEGLGPAPEIRAQIDADGVANRLRKWIAERRKAAGRMPRRYTTIEAAYTRMKEENGFLSDDQARHLTIHGASRNEDGTWSWKFDNYLNIWSITDIPYPEQVKLWEAITCPVLLFYGADSFASNPAKDGRLVHFQTGRLIEYANAGHWLHHDQFGNFINDLKSFL